MARLRGVCAVATRRLTAGVPTARARTARAPTPPALTAPALTAPALTAHVPKFHERTRRALTVPVPGSTANSVRCAGGCVVCAVRTTGWTVGLLATGRLAVRQRLARSPGLLARPADLAVPLPADSIRPALPTRVARRVPDRSRPVVLCWAARALDRSHPVECQRADLHRADLHRADQGKADQGRDRATGPAQVWVRDQAPPLDQGAPVDQAAPLDQDGRQASAGPRVRGVQASPPARPAKQASQSIPANQTSRVSDLMATVDRSFRAPVAPCRPQRSRRLRAVGHLRARSDPRLRAGPLLQCPGLRRHPRRQHHQVRSQRGRWRRGRWRRARCRPDRWDQVRCHQVRWDHKAVDRSVCVIGRWARCRPYPRMV